MSTNPLSAAELEERLNALLDPLLSSHHIASEPAQALAELTRAQQEFVLRWAGVIAKTNAELAYEFAGQAPGSFRMMALEDVEAWVIQTMDVYDKKGLYPAIAVLKQVRGFAAGAKERASWVGFSEVARRLTLFITGIEGRPLKLAAGDEVYTDTETLFLPHYLASLPQAAANLRLYKAMVVHQWAQTRFGTFRLDLMQTYKNFADPEKALRLFHALETIRLDSCVAAEFPGLYREMQQLRNEAGDAAYPPAWATYIKQLRQPQATVEDTYNALAALYDGELPAPCDYQGLLFPERARQVMLARIAREKQQLRAALSRLIGNQDKAPADVEGLIPRFRDKKMNRERGDDFELSLDGQPVAMPDGLRGLMKSIAQDLGEIPQDYLSLGADSEYDRSNEAQNSQTEWEPAEHDEYLLYNEWDYRRQHYRKEWCMLREVDVEPRNEPFVQRTLEKYAALAAKLRRTFEMLRDENKRQKKQKYGDDIDFDALVEAYADLRSGREMTERLFIKLHKVERDIAVMFMVDMSGSTKGWINDAERESLVLLCEALEILGDQYAIYGFSGITRQRCQLFHIKRFDERYTDLVKSRIAGMKPHDYTRMGVIIRHLSKLLNGIDARTKLLITLSDGRPDDYDGYGGDYGIEDTRQALFEAKHNGIHPFCITIDNTARGYLPHMYGAANYTLIDDVRKLPLKVADIYRRLTT
jgi:nitric oxide reductase NorD protein